MQVKIHFLLCISTFIFFQCKKKKTPSFEIEVKIQDINTNAPIENAKINLSAKSLDGSTFSTNFKLIETKLTNSQGLASFDTEFSTIIEFELKTNVEHYIPNLTYLNPDDLSKENKNNTIVYMQSIADVTINIKNQNPFNSQDKITYSSTIPNCNDCLQTPSIVLSGLQIDTSFNGLVLGNQYFKYSYIVTKNNSITQYNDSIYCDAGTQNSVVISF